MINLSIHGITSVELTDPMEFESQGEMFWSSDLVIRRGDERQVVSLYSTDGADALRVSDDAMDAETWQQVAKEQAISAKRWQNVALGQTRRADALQQELDDLRANLAGLSRRMAE